MLFHLDLIKDNDIVTLDIEPLDTSLGRKWAQALAHEIDKGAVIPQTDRIYNLNEDWTERRVVEEINKRIDIINAYDNFIDYRVGLPMTQNDSNRLHHYFEIMRGENDEPNEYYKSSPAHIKEAIEDFNVLIHRWEDLGAPGRIVVHIKDRPMYDLELEDFDAWTLEYQPGDVCINYCHKGKPLFDIFKDNDEVIGIDNIRPQSRYSADFNVGFNYGMARSPHLMEVFDNWLHRQDNLLTSIGYPPGDPRRAIGKGRVGKVCGSAFLAKAKIWGAREILGVRYTP